MPDNREGYVKLGYEIDQQSLSQVKAADDAVIAGLQRIGGEAVKTSATFDRLKQASATIARANDLDALGKQFATLGKSIGDDTAALIQMRQVLKEIGATTGEIDKATRSFKEMSAASADVSSGGGGLTGIGGLRRTGGSLRQLGLDEVGGAISRVGDIQQVAKEIDAVATAFKSLPPPLGAIAAAAGPLILVLGTLTIGLKVFSDGLATGDAQIKKSSDQISQYFQIIQTGTTESIKVQIKKLEADKALAEIDLKYRQANLKAMQDQEHEAAQHYSTLDEGVKAFFKELGVELEQAGVRAGPLTEKIKELEQKSADAQAQIDLYNKALGDNKVAANDAAEAEQKLAAERLKAIEKTISAEQQTAQMKRGGTSAQAEERVKALQDEADAINANLPALEDEAKKSKEAAAELQKYKDRLAEITKEQANLNTNVLPYLKAKEEEKSFLAEATKGSEAYIKKQKEYADLIANESSAGLQKRIDDIEREKKSIQDGLPQLEALGETNEEAKEKAIDLRKRIDELNDAESHLTGEIKAAVDAREAEAKAIEKQKAQATIIEKLEDDKDTIIQKAEADKAAIIQKAGEEQASIVQRSARDRASIEEKYGEKLVEIARNAADEATKALTELQQKQADLRTSLVRDEQKSTRDDADKTYDIQIKAQRAERDALQEHLARIQDIRRGDFAADQKDLLDRNFQSLYLRKLGQNQQIEDENRKFGQGGGQRQQAVQDEIQDAQRASQIQRRERLIAFQQQQADAQLAYQRQLAAAKQAHDRELEQAAVAHARELTELRKKTAQELAELQAKTARELQARQAASARELQVRQAAAVKELQLLERTEQQRLAIIAKYAKQATDLLSKALSTTPVKRAGGGYLEAGQAAMVNEPGSSGNESFNGMALPGAGVFIPSQAGYVNPNGGAAGMTINIPMTIVGATDPEATARAVDDRLVMRLKQVMGK